MTSTRASGTMNPPTPTTSSTRTENALIPGGILRGRIPPTFCVGTSFDSTTGSPRTNSRMATLPATLFTSERASFGYRSFGQAAIATWSAVIVEPREISPMATTIPTVSSLACSAILPFSLKNR